MTVTKDEVAAKAKELGLTLTDSEVEQYVKDGKLPEKQNTQKYEEMRADLQKKTTSELIDMVLDARAEAKDRRLENKSLKQEAEDLTKEINAVKQEANKYPELENKFKALETQLQAARDSEKKRREAVLAKLDEKVRSTVGYLLDAEKIGADSFDATVELFLVKKSNGHEAQSPAGDPPKIELTPREKEEAKRMGLSEQDYKEVMNDREKKSRGPEKISVQPTLVPVK